MMMKVLECLHVMEGVDIRLLIPPTFSPVTVEFIIVMIKVMKMVEVYIGTKIPATFLLAIVKQDLMLTGEL